MHVCLARCASDCRSSSNRAAFDGITRVDMNAEPGQGLCGKIAFPAGFKGGEGSFVPSTASAEKNGKLQNCDHGYLLGFITDEEQRSSRLVV